VRGSKREVCDLVLSSRDSWSRKYLGRSLGAFLEDEKATYWAKSDGSRDYVIERREVA
jgi:hypothetical protein